MYSTCLKYTILKVFSLKLIISKSNRAFPNYFDIFLRQYLYRTIWEVQKTMDNNVPMTKLLDTAGG